MPNMSLSEMRKTASKASQLMKALAHEERLLLLCQLSQHEMCVSELEHSLAILQPSLSQQLGILRRQQLVSTRKVGKQVYYSISDNNALTVLQTLYQLYCTK